MVGNRYAKRDNSIFTLTDLMLPYIFSAMVLHHGWGDNIEEPHQHVSGRIENSLERGIKTDQPWIDVSTSELKLEPCIGRLTRVSSSTKTNMWLQKRCEEKRKRCQVMDSSLQRTLQFARRSNCCTWKTVFNLNNCKGKLRTWRCLFYPKCGNFVCKFVEF